MTTTGLIGALYPYDGAFCLLWASSCLLRWLRAVCQVTALCAVVGSEHSLAMGLNMKRDERLRRAQLANLLLDAIEKAEQPGEPDIAEIVHEFRARWKTPV